MGGQRRQGVAARGFATAVLVAALALPAAGCGLLDERHATTASPDNRLAPLAASEMVTVGAHQVATRCAGRTADPSVLLVSGYDTELSTWDKVQPAIGAFARVCVYDRLGVGNSDAAPRRQTFADMADELDGVVDALHLKRPVVLVAHSLGGMIAATWAEAHRQDLAGLVLVDATPPSYVATALASLPRNPAAKGGELRSGLATLLTPRANAEHLDGQASFDPPAVFGPVGSQPVLALTHSVSEWGDVRRRDGAQLDSAWLGGQQTWAELSSKGRVQIVDQAGHFIQNDQPQALVDAVREVLSGS